MKKIFCYLLVMTAAVGMSMSCEAQSAKRRTASTTKTTQARKTSAPTDLAKFSTFVLKKDGKVQDKSPEDKAVGGDYVALDGGAYFVFIQTNSYRPEFYVIAGDQAYDFAPMFSDAWLDFFNYCAEKITSEGSAKEYVEAGKVAYNAATNSLSYMTDEGKKTIALSRVPASDRRVVTWYSKPAAKPAAQLSINTFCQAIADPESWGITKALGAKLQEMKDENVIAKDLKALGFECKSKQTKREYDDASGEYVTYLIATYAKASAQGTTTIKQEGCNFKITFASAAEKDAFMKTVTAKGYKYSSDWQCYLMPGNEEAHWLGIRISVQGNTVSVDPNAG